MNLLAPLIFTGYWEFYLAWLMIVILLVVILLPRISGRVHVQARMVGAAFFLGVAALTFGLWRAVRDGRFRGTHQVKGADALPIAAEQPEGSLARVVETLGERATLVQFSSAFCAPCRAARVVLSDVAATVPGVRHVEIDAEHHLDVVRRIGVQRTPTTLLLDAHGREISRALGAPRKQAVLASLSAMGINI